MTTGPTRTTAIPSVLASLTTLVAENVDAIEHLPSDIDERLSEAASVLRGAPRIFVLGAGRSGLALRMTAMRLMHLGLAVHVVGEVTTPAISAGDVLLVASGSGTTSMIVRAAQTAVATDATVIAITTDAASPVAELSKVVITLPAAQKLDRSGALSIQYAGGLFEQLVVFIGDALFHSLWKASGATADELWPRHANLE
ncbi:MAG TPA: 6-phospho-3-hexuloisomerase [Microbacteriaceae bacterium]|jgi:6-phospho-3-hexuloisomerase|nr:6-phospho-3-hexuloisomerase [Microbacteriaceae bacterium]